MKVPQSDYSPLVSAIGTQGAFQSRQLDKAYSPFQFGLGLAKGALGIAQAMDQALYQKQRTDASGALLDYETSLRQNVQGRVMQGDYSSHSVPTYNPDGSPVLNPDGSAATHPVLNWSEDFRKAQDETYKRLTAEGGPISRSDVQAELRTSLDAVTQRVTGQAVQQASINLAKENEAKLSDGLTRTIQRDVATGNIRQGQYGMPDLPAPDSETMRLLLDAKTYTPGSVMREIYANLGTTVSAELLHQGSIQLAQKGELAMALSAIQAQYGQGKIDEKQQQTLSVLATQAYSQASAALGKQVKDIEASGDPGGSKLLALRALADKAPAGWKGTVQPAVDSAEKGWLGDVFSQRFTPMIGFSDEDLAAMKAYKDELQGETGLTSYGNNQGLREAHVKQLTTMIDSVEASREKPTQPKPADPAKAYEERMRSLIYNLDLPAAGVLRSINDLGDVPGLEGKRGEMIKLLETWREDARIASPAWVAFRDGGQGVEGWGAHEKDPNRQGLVTAMKSAASAAYALNPRIQQAEILDVLRKVKAVAASTSLDSFAKAADGADPRTVGSHAIMDSLVNLQAPDWISKRDDALGIQVARRLEELYPGIKVDRKKDGSVLVAPVESSLVPDIMADGKRYRLTYDPATDGSYFSIIDDTTGKVTRGLGTGDLKGIREKAEADKEKIALTDNIANGSYETLDDLTKALAARNLDKPKKDEMVALWKARQARIAKEAEVTAAYSSSIPGRLEGPATTQPPATIPAPTFQKRRFP